VIRVFTEDVTAMCDEAIDRLGETKGALAAAGDMVLKANKAKWGNAWKPLAENTVAKKSGGEPGVESGRMKAALTEPGASGQTVELTETMLRIGISTEKTIHPDQGGNVAAYAFEAGAKFPRVGRSKSGVIRQPKRRLMRMTPAVQKAIAAELAKRLLPKP
jgi:hypothetical protein